jgi:osmotically-inducible protein OsmY
MAAVGASKPSSSQGLTPDQETAASAAQGTSDKSAPGSPGAGTEGTPAVGDATISSEVEAAIKAEPALEAQPITVETNNATVTLSGSVAKDSLRSQAEQIAMSVPGVKNVVNHLAVQPS